MKCILCESCMDNPSVLGEFVSSANIAVHYYCLLLAPALFQRGDADRALRGFEVADIVKEARRVRALRCYICKKKQANIGCSVTTCRHSFHLHCGLQKGCQPEFFDNFPTYCDEHIANRNGCVRHKAKEPCGICLEQMGEYNKVSSVWASACCRNGWFHKSCLTQFALSAGYFFKCPLCNNTEQFRNEALMRGIFVPEKDASWELEENAFAELFTRPKKCEAKICRCPQGTEFFENSDNTSDWNLLICDVCGAKSQHRKCAGTHKYICAFCYTFVGGSEEEKGSVKHRTMENNKRRTLSESDLGNLPNKRIALQKLSRTDLEKY